MIGQEEVAHMQRLKQGLRIVGLGIGVWSLSFAWPEVNQMLTPCVMVTGLVLALGAAILAHILEQHLGLCDGDTSDRAGQDRPSRPIPPTPATLTR